MIFDRHLIAAKARRPAAGAGGAPGWKTELADSERRRKLSGVFSSTTEVGPFSWGPMKMRVTRPALNSCGAHAWTLLKPPDRFEKLGSCARR